MAIRPTAPARPPPTTAVGKAAAPPVEEALAARVEEAAAPDAADPVEEAPELAALPEREEEAEAPAAPVPVADMVLLPVMRAVALPAAEMEEAMLEAMEDMLEAAALLALAKALEMALDGTLVVYAGARALRMLFASLGSAVYHAGVPVMNWLLTAAGLVIASERMDAGRAVRRTLAAEASLSMC